MPTEQLEDSEVDASGSASVLSWVAWPAAERKGRSTILVVVIIFLSMLVALIGGDWLWGLTGGILLAASLNRWFIPTTFTITEEDIEVGYPLSRRRVRWSDVRQLVIADGGGWLSTGVEVTRLNARHGVDIYWGRKPNDIMNAVLARGEAVAASGVPLRIINRRGQER